MISRRSVGPPIRSKPTEMQAGPPAPIRSKPTKTQAGPPIRSKPTETQAGPPIRSKPTETQASTPIHSKPTETQAGPPIRSEPTETQTGPPIRCKTTESPVGPPEVTVGMQQLVPCAPPAAPHPEGGGMSDSRGERSLAVCEQGQACEPTQRKKRARHPAQSQPTEIESPSTELEPAPPPPFATPAPGVLVPTPCAPHSERASLTHGPAQLDAIIRRRGGPAGSGGRDSL